MISALDLFKIGIGPSSSHTMGPMIAACRFLERIQPFARDVADADRPRLRAELFGSLAWTGKGHATDTAIVLGLCGESPASIDPDAVAGIVDGCARAERIPPQHGGFRFNPQTDIVFNLVDVLPRHSNAMRFELRDGDDLIAEDMFYSVGGGFVVHHDDEGPIESYIAVPKPFTSVDELLRRCDEANLSIADVQMANELALRPRDDLLASLSAVRDAMFACIDRGLRMDGELPGGLAVRRRAKALHEQLLASRRDNRIAPHQAMDWVSAYAIAVNEENAAGGRVVTAPTNGAAGIVPAVLRYFRDFCPEYTEDLSLTFLLTAAAIGSLIKRNASISGAEVGCQGEVGSASAMAAAGLAAVLGGTPRQVENAAEIAIEHHLGMTCDPIAGLVQIPCIERNAFGAIKSIAAASLALHGDGLHRVSLDEVIETMRQTGVDMASKYKETSQGGLAVNVAAC